MMSLGGRDLIDITLILGFRSKITQSPSDARGEEGAGDFRPLNKQKFKTHVAPCNEGQLNSCLDFVGLKPHAPARRRREIVLHTLFRDFL